MKKFQKLIARADGWRTAQLEVFGELGQGGRRIGPPALHFGLLGRGGIFAKRGFGASGDFAGPTHAVHRTRSASIEH
jgi:hypothetical protein